jgi:Periplasmic binding protein-like domain
MISTLEGMRFSICLKKFALAIAVLEACRAGRLQVPEQVAVIGVDNDELLCQLSTPLLSSIEQGGALYRISGGFAPGSNHVRSETTEAASGG